LYGILAATFGTICVLLYRIFDYSDTFKKIVLLIMFFHLMVAFQMYAAYTQGTISHNGAFWVHIVMALLFFGGYMQDLNLFSRKQE